MRDTNIIGYKLLFPMILKKTLTTVTAQSIKITAVPYYLSNYSDNFDNCFEFKINNSVLG